MVRSVPVSTVPSVRSLASASVIPPSVVPETGPTKSLSGLSSTISSEASSTVSPPILSGASSSWVMPPVPSPLVSAVTSALPPTETGPVKTTSSPAPMVRSFAAVSEPALIEPAGAVSSMFAPLIETKSRSPAPSLIATSPPMAIEPAVWAKLS